MEQRKLIKLKGETKEMSCGEVYEQFQKFIYKAAHSFNNSQESIDDLIQIGSIGLIKAFNSYKIESNYNFITLLATIINNEFRMKLRKEKRSKNEISFDDCITMDADGNSLTLMDVIKEPLSCEEVALDNMATVEMKTYIKQLKPQYAKAIELFYFKNMSQYDIGIELNTTQSYVSRILKNALKFLKKKYEKGELEMSKKEQCYKIFEENSTTDRGKVIDLVMLHVGVTRTTANTYYPTWRREYVGRVMGQAPRVTESIGISKEVKENAENIIKAVEERQKIVLPEPKYNLKDIEDRCSKIYSSKDEKLVKPKGLDGLKPFIGTIDEFHGVNADIYTNKIITEAIATGRKKFIENGEKITAEAMDQLAKGNEKLISSIKNVIAPVEMNGLKVIEEKVMRKVKVQGENGIYEAETSKGVMLTRNGMSIGFQTEEELNEWVIEFKNVFKMIV